MFILSQVFIGLAIICILIAYQQSNKTILLSWMIGANAFQAVSLFLLGGEVGGMLAIVGSVRSVAFAYLDKKQVPYRSMLSLSCLLFFMAASAVATFLTWKIYYEFFLLACVLIFALGNWFKGPHYIRVATIIFALAYIGYAIILHNWLDILLRSIYIAAVVMYYVRQKFKIQNPKFKIEDNLNQCTMHNAQCTIDENLNQCTMHNAQCTIDESPNSSDKNVLEVFDIVDRNASVEEGTKSKNKTVGEFAVDENIFKNLEFSIKD